MVSAEAPKTTGQSFQFLIWFGLVQNNGKKEKLQQMINLAPLRLRKDQEAFLDYWLANLLDTDRRAHGYKSTYYILRFVAIAGSLLLPILTISGNNGAAIIMSFVVAASAGWEAFFRYGEKWQLFRRMSVELEGAGVYFLQMPRPIQDNEVADVFRKFVEKIQGTIKKKVEGYTDIVEQSLPDYASTQAAFEEALEKLVNNALNNNSRQPVQEPPENSKNK